MVAGMPQNSQHAQKEEKEGVGKLVLILGNKCYRCGHAWRPYSLDNAPRVCPACKSPYWDRPRKRFGKNKVKNKGG